jgi:hypothetical protein
LRSRLRKRRTRGDEMEREREREMKWSNNDEMADKKRDFEGICTGHGDKQSNKTPARTKQLRRWRLEYYVLQLDEWITLNWIQTNRVGKEFISMRFISKWISQQYFEWETTGSAKYHSDRRQYEYQWDLSSSGKSDIVHRQFQYKLV